MKTILFICASVLSLAIAATVSAVDTSKLPKAADKQVDFVKDIQPLFEASCLKCHGPEKPKSKYRIDGREAAIKGGSSGDAAIVPGDSEKSLLVHYVTDLIDEIEMPPTDKRDTYPAFTKEQVSLLRAWIDQGAKWE